MAKPKKRKRKKGNNVFKALIWLIILVAVGILVWKFFKEKPLPSLNQDWVLINTIGGTGKGHGQFNQPRQIGLDKSGCLYVMDRDNNRVQKFSAAGEWMAAWGTAGKGKAQFNQPFGLAVDLNRGWVYVVDTWNEAVKRLDTSGQLLKVIKPKAFSFYGPRCIAVAQNGDFFITDTGNHQIVKFDSTGAVVRQWGGNGRRKGQFREPVGIALDNEEHVFVADMENHRVQEFDGDGNFLMQFGYKNFKGVFPLEPYLSIDKEGLIYISDSGAGRFQVYNSKGKFIGIWGRNPKENPFDGPIYVLFSPKQEGFVVDNASQKIYKFTRR